MGIRDLPDMYTQSPKAAGPRTEGIHIQGLQVLNTNKKPYRVLFDQDF